jgi:hypothetical protein
MNHLPSIKKKISFKKAYVIGFIVEKVLKLFRVYNVHPPMTRFVAMQMAHSHYFSHDNAKNALGYHPILNVEQSLETIRPQQ